MLQLTGLFLLTAPSAMTALLARLWLSRALGLKGIRFLGGFVEDPRAATAGRRAAVVLGALVASYLACGVPFGVALAGWGRPAYSTVVNVVPGKPAAAAGVEAGDRVTSVAGTPVVAWEDIARNLHGHAGEPVEVVVVRDGEARRFTVTPDPSPGGNAKIGVTPVMMREPAGAGAILSAVLTQPGEVMAGVAKGLWAWAAGHEQATLSGPVAMVNETAKAANRGAGDAIFFLAMYQSYAWPITAIMAIAMVPRARRAPAARKRAGADPRS
jgi:membrane-associated protease RseP (regulator of RpoE activity)